jgi:hypothetical protein
VDEVITTYLIKIMNTHLQYLVLVASYDFSYPPILVELMNFLVNLFPQMNQGFSMECLLKQEKIIISNQYYQLLLVALLPFFIVILSFLYIITYNFFKRKQNDLMKKLNVSTMDSLKCISLIVILLLYPNMIQTCLETFFCQEVGDAKTSEIRLRKDLALVCWDDSHIKWILALCLPLLIIIGLLFPLLIIRIIVKLRRRGELKERIYLFRYGFFYFGYKRQYFYWEFVGLLRKIVLIAFNIFFIMFKVLDPTYQLLCLLFTVCLSLYLNVQLHPYERALNPVYKLEIKSFYTLFATTYFMFFSLNRDDNMIADEVRWIFGIIAFASNLFFFVPWLGAFLKYFFRR